MKSKGKAIQRDDLESITSAIDKLAAKAKPLNLTTPFGSVIVTSYKGFRIRMRKYTSFDAVEIKTVYETAYEIQK